MSVPNLFTAVTTTTGAQLDANFAACLQLNAANAISNQLNFAPPVIIASAATVNIGAAASNNIQIRGVGTVSAFDSIAGGAIRLINWTGASTITYNAVSMQLVGGVTRTNFAGDASIFQSLGSGNWIELFYQKATGFPIVPNASVAANLYMEQNLGGF